MDAILQCISYNILDMKMSGDAWYIREEKTMYPALYNLITIYVHAITICIHAINI